MGRQGDRLEGNFCPHGPRMLLPQPLPPYPFSIPAQNPWLERRCHTVSARMLVLESVPQNVFPWSPACQASLTPWSTTYLMQRSNWESPGDSRGPGKQGHMGFPCDSWIPPSHTAQLPESAVPLSPAQERAWPTSSQCLWRFHPCVQLAAKRWPESQEGHRSWGPTSSVLGAAYREREQRQR